MLDNNPSGKPNQMHPYKCEAAAKPRNGVRHLICLLPIGLGSFLKVHNRLHILLCHFFYCVRFMIM